MPRLLSNLLYKFFLGNIKENNYEDIVGATPTDDRRVFEFERVVERSGHSTYMLIVEADNEKFGPYWDKLQERGCSYEPMEMEFSMGRRRLLSVDVPPAANVHEIYRLLEEGEAHGIWTFQEGYAYLSKDT